MRLGQRAPQAIGVRRNEDQMNVIGHQAPGQTMYLALTAGCRHQLDICGIILVPEEYRLPLVAPLGHVMRNPGNHNARQPYHPGNLSGRAFGN